RAVDEPRGDVYSSARSGVALRWTLLGTLLVVGCASTLPPQAAPPAWMHETFTADDLRTIWERAGIATPTSARATRTIDLSATDSDFAEVMDAIAQRVERTIIVAGGIHEKVTVQLRGVPWR